MLCCAGFAAVRREANRDDAFGDRFGKLKADERVTRQPRKRRAADALRILFVTRSEDSVKDAIYLSSTKTAGGPSRGLLVTQPSVMEWWSSGVLNTERPPAALDVGCWMLAHGGARPRRRRVGRSLSAES